MITQKPKPVRKSGTRGSKKILVVDNDPAIRELYERVLREEGYSVLSAAEGLEAIDKARLEEPDLLVLDVRLPGLDGLEVMSQILEQSPTLLIIVNTAFSYYRESFRSWCANAYLIKSSDLTELKETIRSLLEKSE